MSLGKCFWKGTKRNVLAKAGEAKAERSVLSMPKRKLEGLSKVTRITKLIV